MIKSSDKCCNCKYCREVEFIDDLGLSYDTECDLINKVNYDYGKSYDSIVNPSDDCKIFKSNNIRFYTADYDDFVDVL